ncbi:MAG TPA: thiamine phosphate synthase [Croceibacterium sp.]|nr:thiamine phosphate synthase [Croceibacterium sp.]
MRARQTLPMLWLLSDQRNDAMLEGALARLPRGSGFVFRHYHLDDAPRRSRFDRLALVARSFDHVVIVSGSLGGRWEADGFYGSASTLGGVPASALRLATAHDAAEIAAADHIGAHGVFLSPVFPTRSHPGAETLGADGFRQLAALSKAPVIALGGMNAARAEELGWPRWAAIDALS